MPSIEQLLPDEDGIVSLSIEELAYYVLKAAVSERSKGLLHFQRLRSADGKLWPDDVELALREAWSWLEINLMLLPAPGINGTGGYRTLGRRGRELLDRQAFDAFVSASRFPRELLHPSISDRVWIELARGSLDTAVFISFRQVEEAVRDAGGFEPTDHGMPLMRKAFDHKKGPLTDLSQPEPEREALAHLFAGAIGSYKNPHSHRTVAISDPTEAQEMIMLASHLLRIVDSRRSAG